MSASTVRRFLGALQMIITWNHEVADVRSVKQSCMSPMSNSIPLQPPDYSRIQTALTRTECLIESSSLVSTAAIDFEAITGGH